MWGLLTKFWTVARNGLAISSFKKGIDKAGSLWSRWRRPYKPIPAIQPGTRDTKDPLSALGMILMGVWIGNINFGLAEEVLKALNSFVMSGREDSQKGVMGYPMGGLAEEVLKALNSFVMSGREDGQKGVMGYPMGWDGASKGRGRKGGGWVLKSLESRKAEREGAIAGLSIPEITPEEVMKRSAGNA